MSYHKLPLHFVYYFSLTFCFLQDCNFSSECRPTISKEEKLLIANGISLPPGQTSTHTLSASSVYPERPDLCIVNLECSTDPNAYPTDQFNEDNKIHDLENTTFLSKSLIGVRCQTGQQFTNGTDLLNWKCLWKIRWSDSDIPNCTCTYIPCNFLGSIKQETNQFAA